MKTTRAAHSLLLMTLCILLVASACSRKTPIASTTPDAPGVATPPVSAPTVSLAVEPPTVERGQAATLRWTSTNAEQASLDQNIGEVPVNGERRVFPSQTTTYAIQVRGRNGEASARSTLNVTVQVADTPTQQQIQESLVDAVARLMRDAHFDYDKYEIRVDARETLNQNAQSLRTLMAQFSGYEIVIEGHCDERGSAEYNLGLGDRRAVSTREFLTSLGIPGQQLQIISFGKERPVCTDQEEACWQMNRRAHFAARPIAR